MFTEVSVYFQFILFLIMMILVVDDDPSFNQLLSNYLKREGFEVISVHSSNSALEVVSKQKIDLLLSDYRLPDMDGLALIAKIKNEYPGLPVILITNYADIRLAVNSIKLGAFEFVSKPVIPDELLKVVNLALSRQAQQQSSEKSNKHKQSPDYIIGKDEQAAQVWKHLSIVGPTKMNVLIVGESGTGKEYVARNIHALSRRAEMPFVAVDCGALPVELAASELFGHVKGAFTGAITDKRGLFEEANKGTLFLDEVGNLPYEVQVLLLRAIQEGVIKRVGSNKEIKVDVRIVAATNDFLKRGIENNTFRNDLFHRLNEFELSLPPLRNRLEDLDEFSDFFVQQACEEFDKPLVKVHEEVRQIFRNYSWPGNLRELKNIIRRAVLLCTGTEITPDVLPMGLKDITDEQPFQPGKEIEGNGSVSLNIKDKSKENEKKMIIDALKIHKYNKSKAAEALNIDRSTLYKKIKDYNIEI